MRIGNNPSNHEIVKPNTALHRVIIPVYIPHENDYFKDAFQIFEYCVSSILKTSTTHLKISIISNGCSNEVNDKLLVLYKKYDIDELIVENEGIGKINSVLKALRTAEERFITITDADVLFINGWEENVLKVFKEFPKAGAVCPTPVFRKHFQLTSNIWFNYLFSKKLAFTKVKNPEAMTKFANSIGWPWLDEKYKDVYATITSKNGIVAMVGCSHFVATYKREVFTEMPVGNTEFKIRGNSEYLYTDVPVIKKGGYRLSTEDNYTYHMGNVLEDWMTEKYHHLITVEKIEVENEFQLLKKSWISYKLTHQIFTYLIAKPWLKQALFKFKGLTKEQCKHFLA
ncbi:glycosyltransferase family A protein [Lutibacter sp.]|uniref:glycosyltransferase family A protein n=1 Tax=Lutibacter sp. TaxID=1925666 RepID=UPI001A341C1A|nr:glycosyltransferase family A protein [Lutibacter sp.]MBI9042248.1 glycosyltransferase family 2 protein [Lutibacter sp.]